MASITTLMTKKVVFLITAYSSLVVGAVLAVVNPQGCPWLAPLFLPVLEIQGNTGSI